MVLKHVLTLLVISSLFLLFCQQREHANIFDPQNQADSLDLNLHIVQSDSIVRLVWNAPSPERYSGFKVYRKSSGEAGFSVVGSVRAGHTAFNDSSVQSDRNYWYYVTVTGEDAESPPTKALHTMPGAGTFWLLDYWDFYIYRLTYDLEHIIATKYAVWRPQEMSFTPDFSAALLTYPEYHYFELFSPANGSGIRGFDDLNHPFACIYNQEMQAFWVGDSSGGLYTLGSSDARPQMLSDLPRRPIKICKNKEKLYFVLDMGRHSILIFASDGTLIRSVNRLGEKTLENPFFIASSPATGDVFVLDAAEGTNYLYRYNPDTDAAQQLFSDAYLSAVTFDSVDQSLWLAINMPDSAKILQLFLSDLRLTEHNGFIKVSDIVLSPYTGHILVADAGKKELTHFRRDFSRIGVFKRALYPFRIYNQ